MGAFVWVDAFFYVAMDILSVLQRSNFPKRIKTKQTDRERERGSEGKPLCMSNNVSHKPLFPSDRPGTRGFICIVFVCVYQIKLNKMNAINSGGGTAASHARSCVTGAPGGPWGPATGGTWAPFTYTT